MGLIAVPRQPVGASHRSKSGQRSGRNRLLVDEGERPIRTGGRLQAVQPFRHEVQEGQPTAYRGYVLGEQRRQLQGLVRTLLDFLLAGTLEEEGPGNGGGGAATTATRTEKLLTHADRVGGFSEFFAILSCSRLPPHSIYSIRIFEPVHHAKSA